MRRTVTLLTTAALGTGGLLLTAPAAHAATGSTASVVDGGHTVRFTAGDGQSDYVEVGFVRSTGSTATFSIRSSGPITPGKGCTQPDGDDPMVVSCVVDNTWPTSRGRVALYLGDKDDTAQNHGAYGIVMHGGPGNDTLEGNYRNGNYGGGPNVTDRLYGEGGNDVVWNGYESFGGDGADHIRFSLRYHGDAGNDQLTGTNYNEEFHGGTGDDTVSGGSGNDTLYGNDGADHLYANNGDDRVSGGAGADHITGGAGRDTVYGNNQNDVIHGNNGNDWISGGTGSDTISGGTGTDTIRP